MNEESELDEYAPWVVLMLTLIGLVLRILLLAFKGLWLDEVLSVWVSSHRVADMLQWIARIDQHPPLYYLFLHYWIALKGDTVYNLRLLSAFFGAATIPFIYLTGKRMSGTLMGLVAALVFAISPFNIRFAQETRMYTLLTFNVAVAIYALVRLLTDSRAVKPVGSQFLEFLRVWRTPGPHESDHERDFSYADETRDKTGWRGWISRHHWSPIQTIETDLAWVVYIVFTAAALLSHNLAGFFLLATNIFVLALMLYQAIKKPGSPPAFQAPSAWNWIKAQVGILLLCSLWIVTFIRQAGRVNQEIFIPKPGWQTVIQTMISFLNETSPTQARVELVVWILYAIVLCFGLVYFSKKISHLLFLAALFAIPFLGELIVSIRRPIFLDQTIIWITIPLFLLLAAGIVQLRYRALILVVLGIFATVNLFSTGDYLRFAQKEDWQDPAGFVANFVQKDDLILFNATRSQIPFDYYFKTYEEQYAINVEKHGVPADMFADGVLEPTMTEDDVPELISMLSGHRLVWLIYSHNWNTDPKGLIPQTLASSAKLILVRDYNGVQVQLYAVP